MKVDTRRTKAKRPNYRWVLPWGYSISEGIEYLEEQWKRYRARFATRKA